MSSQRFRFRLSLPWWLWVPLTITVFMLPVLFASSGTLPALGTAAMGLLLWACTRPTWGKQGFDTPRTPRTARRLERRRGPRVPVDEWRRREKDDKRRARSRKMRKSPRWMQPGMCRRGSLPK